MEPEGLHKEITIRDLAKELALSPATVSRALNDEDTVKKQTKRRVFELAEKLGYRTNNFARILRNRRTNTIGVIVPRLNSHVMSAVIAGMEKITSKEGYSLIIMQSNESKETEAACANILFNKCVDGLMVSLSYETADLSHFKSFAQKDIPVILFDRVNSSNEFVNIFIDNYKAAYEITTHLVKQGRRRILHITADSSLLAYTERCKGYKQALEEAGIPFNEQYIIKGDLTREGGVAVAEAILQWNKQPDAIFAAGDNCAVGCMQALKASGMRIPEDIAIAGFNNDPVATVIEPSLTTVNYPGYEMGETAAHQLIYHLKGAVHGTAVNTILLRSELVIRHSTQSIAISPVKKV